MLPNRKTLPFRLGAGALGLLIGLPLGLAAAFLGSAFLHTAHISFAVWVFSTSGALAIACFLCPDAALEALPWLIYFILGAIPNAQNWKKHAGLLPGTGTAPRLRSAFRIGIIASVIFAGVVAYMAITYP